VEGSVRMTNDRDQWRKYVHGVWPTPALKTADELNCFRRISLVCHKFS